MKFLSISAIVLSVIAIVLSFTGGLQFGASAGTDHYFAETFLSGLTSSGATLISGPTLFSVTPRIEKTASSSIQIGNSGSGVGAGCIILGDSGGTTSTPVYITASGATITATTTRPAVCATVQ